MRALCLICCTVLQTDARCCADANKKLLIQTSEPIKLIMEALLLDPEHARNRGDFGQSDEVKAAIQCDAAECIMQLALFPPCRDMLRQDAAVEVRGEDRDGLRQHLRRGQGVSRPR